MSGTFDDSYLVCYDGTMSLPHVVLALVYPSVYPVLKDREDVLKLIYEYWTNKLSESAGNYPSLKYLRIGSLALGHGPHPIFTSYSTPHDVRVSIIYAKMILGTYCSCWHVRHWQHVTGQCLLPGCGHLPDHSLPAPVLGASARLVGM